MRLASQASSRDNQPLNDSSILNSSAHFHRDSCLEKTQELYLQKTAYSTQNDANRLDLKENVGLPQLSPHKLLLQKPPTKGTQSKLSQQQYCNPSQIQNVGSEAEAQLTRKVKVLEARIQEVHQEKQACLVRAHEENRRLAIENQHLKNTLGNYERKKTMEMIDLQQKINRSYTHTQYIPVPIQVKKPELINQ